MSFTDTLLVTLIGGLFLWAMKSVVGHEIKRRRIKAAILSEVVFILISVKEIKEFLEGSFANTIKVNEEIKYSVDFTPEKPEIYHVHAPTLTSYLSKEELVKTIKFYRAFNEFEVLCTGFFLDLSEWKKQAHKLSNDDVQYVEKKKARIISVANILTSKEVKVINDLPNDYRGQLTADTIVR